jgi:hypothetical protein
MVIETIEALLIESLEPPLNRRRGDSFSTFRQPTPRAISASTLVTMRSVILDGFRPVGV